MTVGASKTGSKPQTGSKQRAKAASGTKSSSTAPTRAKSRRSPITRTEGERRLVDAALELIKTRPFSEVSVRDIAEVADVNHGFVHTWFGSKHELFAQVAHRLMEDLSSETRESTDPRVAMNPFDDRIVLLVRLVIWLHLEGHDLTREIDFLIVQSLRDRYRDVEGLTPADSESAAFIAAAIGIAVGSFTPILQGTNTDFGQIFPMWRHILGLLAEHPRQ